MRQKLNLITLGVADLQRAITFYEQGLGWKKSAASVEELAHFPLGGIVLALHSRMDLAADAMVSAEGHGFSGIKLSYNAHRQEEVDEVLKKVKAAGATIIKPAQKVYDNLNLP